MIKLSGKKALVTGGSRGIGEAISIMLARAGADVALIYRKERKSAERVALRIGRMGRKALAVRADVEKYGDCLSAVGEIMRKFGRIDILINNAGIWESGEIGKMSPDQWHRTIGINLGGTFNMCNVVVPLMKKKKYGRIVNIASTAGQRGEPFYSHYAASKGGIISFTKSIAAELIKSGIWVNCVAPGWVKTEMVSGEYKNMKKRREILRAIPRGTIGNPEEIAGPVIFLSSSLSDNIVGEILNVNGGSLLCG